MLIPLHRECFCVVFIYTPLSTLPGGRKHCFYKGFGMIRELCIKQGGAVQAL